MLWNEPLGESLAQEVDEGEAGHWDPDAWEEEVIQFTRQMGRRMMQTWAEVKAEQAKAQGPDQHRCQPLRHRVAPGSLQPAPDCAGRPRGRNPWGPMREHYGVQPAAVSWRIVEPRGNTGTVIVDRQHRTGRLERRVE